MSFRALLDRLLFRPVHPEACRVQRSAAGQRVRPAVEALEGRTLPDGGTLVLARAAVVNWVERVRRAEIVTVNHAAPEPAAKAVPLHGGRQGGRGRPPGVRLLKRFELADGRTLLLYLTHAGRTVVLIKKGPPGPRGPVGPAGAQGPAGPPAAPLGPSDFGTNTNQGAAGNASDFYLGQIVLSAGSIVNGVPCDGRLLSINQNQALFSLLGTRFGGDGQTTFAIPDLRSVAPNGLTYSIIVQGIFPARL
jgi:hypothetical protein